MARHHGSLARYQSTVSARPASNVRLGAQPSVGQLRAVHRVSTVVARPVLHGPDQRPGLAEAIQQQGDRVAVRHLGAARDVVGLAAHAVAQDEVDAGRMVRDVEPVAPLLAVAVHRQRQVVDGVGDEQRDELLGMLVRAVRVRAAGRHRIEAVGDHVAADQQLPGGLGRGVRRARGERAPPRSRARRRSSRRPRPSTPAGSAADGRPSGRPRAARARR